MDAPFAGVLRALDAGKQRKALRGAMRREANRLRKAAASAMAAGGLGRGTRARLSSGIRARVYPEKCGAGFMVSVAPRGNKGIHVNRRGLKKPVLLWAEEGTRLRRTKSRTRVSSRSRKGHATGRMRRYGFLRETDRRAAASVEGNLFADFRRNLLRAAGKEGLA